MSPQTVWLASYPKSGNTWVRALIAALDHGHVGLDSTIRNASIASARAPLEFLTGLVSSELRADEVERLRPLVDALVDDRRPPREHGLWHRKIHDALFGPRGGPPIVSPEGTAAAVYLVRDPRDVAVSYAHHQNVDVAQVVRDMADPGATAAGKSDRATPQLAQHLGTWSSHVSGWVDHDLFPMVVVRYEDLIAHPVESLERIANALGRTATPAQLAAAVEAARFDKLQAQEAETGFRERPNAGRAFFRRGVAGAWRDELSPELARRIEADHAQVMERFGYLANVAESGA